MHFVNLRPLLDDMFDQELAVYGAIRGVEFLHRSHTDVYRVRTERATLIAHSSATGSGYLERLRRNLAQLAALEDPRIPRIVAWRSASNDLARPRWAILVCSDLPGHELARRNFSLDVWMSVCECLERVHAVRGEGGPACGTVGHGHDAFDFRGFAAALLLRIGDLPLRNERVCQHLEEMAKYVEAHSADFRIPPRLIHGDLDRSNIVVQGGRAGVLDWASLGVGDYAFDLAMLKFMLDSVSPRSSSALVRERARAYRAKFEDDSLEVRLRFFLALAGLIHAFWCADDTRAFAGGRAWRVRAGYLHSEAQWDSPLRLDAEPAGAPAVRTEQWALDVRQPLRGAFYMVAPKRVG